MEYLDPEKIGRGVAFLTGPRACGKMIKSQLGVPIYLIPAKGAKLEMLREYKTILTGKNDVWNNTICMDENDAINVIKSQMSLFQWIISKYKIYG